MGSKLLGMIAATALTVAATAATARADSVFLNGYSSGGRAIAAELEYEFTDNTLTLTLRNQTLNSNAVSPAELLTGLSFTVGTGTSTYTLVSGTGDEITIDGNKDISSVNAGADIKASGHWALTGGTDGDLDLDWNGGSGSSRGIIAIDDNGDETGSYPNANGGIAGNPAHQPFIWYEGVFVISNDAFDANTTLSDVIFYFGTNRESTAAVPLPPAALLGLGLLGGLGALRARRRARVLAD